MFTNSGVGIDMPLVDAIDIITHIACLHCLDVRADLHKSGYDTLSGIGSLYNHHDYAGGEHHYYTILSSHHRCVCLRLH